jgi:hypothetical protein
MSSLSHSTVSKGRPSKAHQKMSALPHFADGGFIDGLKTKMFGPKETVTEKYARQDAELKRKAAAAAPAPAAEPAAEPQKAISAYSSMSTLQAREKAAGLKDGGPVVGPGTGTSDSVPIMASHGEYMLPADTTKALGGKKVLDKIVAATHTPTGKPAVKNGKSARADGGLIGEEPNRRLDAATALSQIPTGGTGSGPTPGGAPYNPIRDSDIGRNITNAMSAVSPAAGGGAARLLSSVGKIATAGAATPIAARIAPYIPPVAGLGGIGIASAPSTAAPVPPTPSTPPVAGPAAALSPQPSAAQQLATPPATQTGVITRQGNTYSGVDVGADATIQHARNPGAGVTSIPGSAVASSTPSQDMALAEARNRAAARGDFDGVRDSYIAQGQSFGGQDANSVAREKLQRHGLSPLGTPGRKFAQDLVIADQSNQTQRRGQDATTSVARARLSMDQTSANIDNQAKVALQAAQRAYADATTPAEREAAEENLRALQGRYEAPNRYTAVRGGQTVDPTTGVAVREPDLVLNNQTGQYVPQAGAKPARSAAIAEGSVSTVNGKQARFTGGKWVPL